MNCSSSKGRVMSGKRFTISKPYEGPPIPTPWGEFGGGYEIVEEYDDELTARVRVAILNEGLPKKKYVLEKCVDAENGEWVEVDDADDGEAAS
jgi:hypothetical protein